MLLQQYQWISVSRFSIVSWLLEAQKLEATTLHIEHVYMKHENMYKT